MTERSYYLAHGESEAKVRGFFARRAAAMNAANDLAKSLGGDGAVGSRRVVGILFKSGAPDGWTVKGRTNKGESFCMPLRKSKAGKELAARISALCIPDGSDLHTEFSRDGGHMSSEGLSITINYISAEIRGGKVIVSVPHGMDFVPPDSAPLKTSEYWAIKELADTK